MMKTPVTKRQTAPFSAAIQEDEKEEEKEENKQPPDMGDEIEFSNMKVSK